MRRVMFTRLGMVLAACLLFLVQPVRADDRLTIFAAASLQDVLKAVADLYEGGEPPVLSFAASSTLARQIEHGAPANLFISADENWVDYLAERRLIAADSRRVLLGNRLALIVPVAQRTTVIIDERFEIADFLNGGRLAMADPDSVPAGRYGKAALTRFGLWDAVAGQVVRADNVRAALTFVMRGEVAAGIVYRTDALATDRVAVAALFPEDSHPPIRYPVAIVKGNDTAQARAFLEFLAAPAVTATFERFGFAVP